MWLLIHTLDTCFWHTHGYEGYHSISRMNVTEPAFNVQQQDSCYLFHTTSSSISYLVRNQIQGSPDILEPYGCVIISLVPGRLSCNLKFVMLKLISRIDILNFFVKLPSGECYKSSQIASGNDLVQVPCHQMMSLGHNESNTSPWNLTFGYHSISRMNLSRHLMCNNKIAVIYSIQLAVQFPIW